MSVSKDNTQYKGVPTEENGENEPVEKPSSYGYGVRHIQLWLAGVSLTIAFAARSHIGVTIVAMTKPRFTNMTDINNATIMGNKTTIIGTYDNNTNWENLNDFNAFDEDSVAKKVTTEHPTPIDEKNFVMYEWPKSTQEMILGSFYLGYSIMMFPMGMVCQRWGGKLLLQFCLLVNALAAISTPWLMTWGGSTAICACRALQGIAQAGLLPAVQNFISNWSNPGERGKFSAYTFTGTTLGTVIAFQLAGFLASSSWGWPSTYWVTGGLCLIMFISLSFSGSSSPAEHKRISEEERNHITGNVNQKVVKKSLKIPWKAILTSKHFWATMCTNVGSGMSFTFFANQCPSYIHYILGMDVRKSGVLSSLPYASNIMMNVVYGILTHYITSRKILSVANSRRLFNCISQLGETCCYIAVSFTKNVALGVTCMVFSMTFHAAIHCSWMVNYIDLAPNYAGTLLAIGNTVSCIASTLLPVLISSVITDVYNQFQWRVIFLIMAAISFTSNLIFVIFMSADTQPWNNYGYEKTETEEYLEKDK